MLVPFVLQPKVPNYVEAEAGTMNSAIAIELAGFLLDGKLRRSSE
jgi:hypothetical protein